MFKETNMASNLVYFKHVARIFKKVTLYLNFLNIFKVLYFLHSNKLINLILNIIHFINITYLPSLVELAALIVELLEACLQYQLI